MAGTRPRPPVGAAELLEHERACAPSPQLRDVGAGERGCSRLCGHMYDRRWKGGQVENAVGVWISRTRGERGREVGWEEQVVRPRESRQSVSAVCAACISSFVLPIRHAAIAMMQSPRKTMRSPRKTSSEAPKRFYAPCSRTSTTCRRSRCIPF